MDVKLYSFLSVGIISLVSLVGVLTLTFSPRRKEKFIFYLVSFATGGLLGGAFFHLLPEAFKELEANKVSFWSLGGLLLFFILEKFLRWQHCHVPAEKVKHPAATLNLIGDGLHNFIDGVIVAASYAVSIPLGVSTTLAVILHEIPQEIGDFAVLVFGGFSYFKALLFNFLCSLTALGGVFIFWFFNSYLKNYTFHLIALAAGGFIYIATSDLIPELHKISYPKERLKPYIQIIFIILGSLCLMIGK